MKKVLNIINQRRSIRHFLEKPVERDKIINCINAARLAPSAGNRQPWRFIVIDDVKRKSEFCRNAFSGIYSSTKWASRAPVIIAIIADLNSITHRIGGGLQKIPFYFIDIGIAGEHLILQAQELQLGTCWIGWFNFKKAKNFLRIPKDKKLCQLIALGYPEQSKKKDKKLKSLNEILFFNKWGLHNQINKKK